MRIKPLQIGHLNVDDGLDGDVCLTIEARDKWEPERCFYLKPGEVDSLLDWIKQFRESPSANTTPGDQG